MELDNKRIVEKVKEPEAPTLTNVTEMVQRSEEAAKYDLTKYDSNNRSIQDTRTDKPHSNICGRCRGIPHSYESCPAKEQVRRSCQRLNHFSRVCR